MLLSSACATGRPQAHETIDFVTPGGQKATLATLHGKVVLLDVCASWAMACNGNARVVDAVLAELPNAPVEAVTLLIDEPRLAREAARAYVDVLQTQHPVVIAGTVVREGTSALGPVAAVPRLLILDREGRIVVDESVALTDSDIPRLVERVRALLPR